MSSSKILNINDLYNGIDKHLLLVEKYIEIENFVFILKACRLKPYIVFKNQVLLNKKIILYDHWFDEFNTSIKIQKNKAVKIIHNDLSVINNINTDMYFGLSLSNIVKISKLLYIYLTKDEDTKNDACLLSFLGIDNYLRTYLYFYNSWIPVTSLLLGLDNLKFIFKNCNIKYFKKLNKKNNIKMPCQEGEAWLSYLPANEKLIGELESNIDFSFLTNNKRV